jgi:hypothetical protein
MVALVAAESDPATVTLIWPIRPCSGQLSAHALSRCLSIVKDCIPEILAEQRLGHEVPGMRGLYAHASQQMSDELTAALQIRWEDSLRERAAIVPLSPSSCSTG